MSSNRSRSIAGSVALAIALSIITVPANATPAQTVEVTASAPGATSPGNLDQALDAEAQDLEEGLEYILSIPDEVLLQGDAATQAWVQQNSPSANTPEGVVTAAASVLGCTTAIVSMIGGNLVGAAKLLKIKKYIKELGGVKDAVQLMWGASFSTEKMLAVGGALGSLAAELTGVAAIRDKCFA